ncbi:hypothetical protein ACJJTC_005483 [Scirpophaga incertulas]
MLLTKIGGAWVAVGGATTTSIRDGIAAGVVGCWVGVGIGEEEETTTVALRRFFFLFFFFREATSKKPPSESEEVGEGTVVSSPEGDELSERGRLTDAEEGSGVGAVAMSIGDTSADYRILKGRSDVEAGGGHTLNYTMSNARAVRHSAEVK